MRFLLFVPIIESASLKMWHKVERSTRQFVKRKENSEFSEALPFHYLATMLSSGGRTKNLVRNIDFVFKI